MKLFSLISMQFDRFETAVKSYISKTLSGYNAKYGSNTIFGQLIDVLGGVVQNMLSYIEDSLTEQNKYTATRKKSIYGLASLSGYNPSLGSAASLSVRLSWVTNNNNMAIIIPNKSKITCLQNGMNYNIILPQEAVIWRPGDTDKVVNVVEGTFETQIFTVDGGQLYSQNVTVTNDVDIDYLEVYVNDVLWTRVESLYDMDPAGLQYVCKTGLKTGFDLIFGDDQNGKKLSYGDVVKVTYLLCNGELGNINPNSDPGFTFVDNLLDVNGDNVKADEVMSIEIVDPYTLKGGTYSDSVDKVRNMIGMNSRALVLADPKNYKLFFNKFSFIGYNRTWTEMGSLVINSLIIKNYKNVISEGKTYFDLTESDFFLSDEQKRSIYNSISSSGRQLAGVNFSIISPVLQKYAMYIYVKLKNENIDHSFIENKIRVLIGDFFVNIQSDIFIPKSDIIHLIKENIDDVDGVNVYILSGRNETAIIDGHYTNTTYTFNPTTNTYQTESEEVYLYDGENPGLGIDEHGNIILSNNDQFPVLMGGWDFLNNNGDKVRVLDPLVVVFES